MTGAWVVMVDEKSPSCPHSIPIPKGGGEPETLCTNVPTELFDAGRYFRPRASLDVAARCRQCVDSEIPILARPRQAIHRPRPWEPAEGELRRQRSQLEASSEGRGVGWGVGVQKTRSGIARRAGLSRPWPSSRLSPAPAREGEIESPGPLQQRKPYRSRLCLRHIPAGGARFPGRSVRPGARTAQDKYLPTEKAHKSAKCS
ncbi:hypothetical protein GGR56DRAFT_656100 [Xylariaceae sp. FL0804]|nr:hypothetical protein GGR56DRAFT_656100 [Xylariaceae sp. FL0804]